MFWCWEYVPCLMWSWGMIGTNSPSSCPLCALISSPSGQRGYVSIPVMLFAILYHCYDSSWGLSANGWMSVPSRAIVVLAYMEICQHISRIGLGYKSKSIWLHHRFSDNRFIKDLYAVSAFLNMGYRQPQKQLHHFCNIFYLGRNAQYFRGK